MKKFAIALTAVTLCTFGFVGCSKSTSNKELAKTIESRSTELVYSVETMDSVELKDLETTTSNSTTNSSKSNSSKQSGTASAAVLSNSNVPVVRTTSRAKPTQNRMRGANPKVASQTATQNSTTNSVATTKVPAATVSTAECTDANCNTSTTTSTNATSTNKITLTTTEIGEGKTYAQELIEKRAQVMLLCSKVRKGDIKVSKENQKKIDECLDLINSTSTYLEKTKGSLKKGLAESSSSTANKVALREKIAIRQAKLQTSILAMDEIISILGGNSTQTTQNTTTNSSSNTATTKSNTVSTKSSLSNTNNSTTNINKNTTSTKSTTANNTQNTSSAKNTTSQNTSIRSTTQTRRTTYPNNKRYYPSTLPLSTADQNVNTSSTANQTQKNDAVSILVKPIKTSASTISQTNQKNQPTEYVVNPQTTSSNNMSGTILAKLPKAKPIPQKSSLEFDNIKYPA